MEPQDVALLRTKLLAEAVSFIQMWHSGLGLALTATVSVPLRSCWKWKRDWSYKAANQERLKDSGSHLKLQGTRGGCFPRASSRAVLTHDGTPLQNY